MPRCVHAMLLHRPCSEIIGYNTFEHTHILRTLLVLLLARHQPEADKGKHAEGHHHAS